MWLLQLPLNDNLLPDLIGWSSLVTRSICKPPRQRSKQVVSLLSEQWQTWDKNFKVESNDFDFQDFSQYSLGPMALKTHITVRSVWRSKATFTMTAGMRQVERKGALWGHQPPSLPSGLPLRVSTSSPIEPLVWTKFLPMPLRHTCDPSQNSTQSVTRMARN